MINRNHLKELRKEREREEQEIKEMHKFYNSNTKIIAKINDIKTWSDQWDTYLMCQVMT